MEEKYKEAKRHFETRTRRHITLVQKYIKILIEKNHFRDTEIFVLENRSQTHDKSKFSDKEKKGFIWLDWFFKEKMDEYPKGKETDIKRALKRHHYLNPHHPEYYQDIGHMVIVDIAEMIADHAAMGEELGDDLTEYTKKVTITKYHWNEYQKYLIWKYVNALK